MKRKFDKHECFKQIKHMKLKDRIDIVDNFKADQMAVEVRIVRDMIHKTAKAIDNSDRVFEQYIFQNSWLDMLQQFALKGDGTLHSDWETRLRMWASHWRYNDALATISNEQVFRNG